MAQTISHPVEETEGYKRLLESKDATFTAEQIAAKVGKTPAHITTRLKLTDLYDEAVAAFYQDHIDLGHALLLAKLPAEQQKPALKACVKEVYTASAENNPVHILLPIRSEGGKPAALAASSILTLSVFWKVHGKPNPETWRALPTKEAARKKAA